MIQKSAQKPRGRPKGTANKPSKSTKFIKSIPSKLETLLKELKGFSWRGEITGLSIQKDLINASSEYTYVSFKIPKKEAKK